MSIPEIGWLHALSVLLAAPGGLLEALGRQRAGILLLIGALGTGVTIGAVGVRWLSDYGTHEARIAELEDWRTIHEDTVTAPGLARIETTEERIDSLFREVVMIRAMTYQMYCHQWPSRCEARPSRQNGPDAEGGTP